MNAYNPGDQVTFYISNIASSSGAVLNPTTIRFLYKNPAGTVTAVTTSGTDITQDSSGNYHTTLTIPSTAGSVGTWYYQWEGTGTAVFVEPGSFRISSVVVST